jgi:RimJ/RimL family protein N-acetyltransferase
VFASAIADYWNAPFDAGTVLFADGGFRLSVNPSLAADRRVQVLTTDGLIRAVVTPEIAAQLGQVTSLNELHTQLGSAGLALNGADFLYYFGSHDRPTAHPSVRRLSADDAALFARFESATSDQDRDDAFVELDHWAVFGAIVDGELVSAASAYPWSNSPVADMGVLTVVSARGAGHGRAVIHALSAFAIDEGYQPQYRCQLDNAASIALAGRAGLSLFGTWDVIAPE